MNKNYIDIPFKKSYPGELKWKINYFSMGGFRIECTDCHHYATGFTEWEAYHKLKQQTITCPHCITCAHKFRERENIYLNKPVMKRSWLVLWRFIKSWWRREII